MGQVRNIKSVVCISIRDSDIITIQRLGIIQCFRAKQNLQGKCNSKSLVQALQRWQQSKGGDDSMARSLNKVELIGNLAKDAELRTTPQGVSVCSFVVVTDRNWTTDSGEKKEQVDFHRVIAWNKLAELCERFLKKGNKVYVSGRISNRSYEKDGEQKQITEIVIDDMILLNSQQRTAEQAAAKPATPTQPIQPVQGTIQPTKEEWNKE